MWIARDLDGGLYLYDKKPIQRDGYHFNAEYSNYTELDEELFPELSYDDGPKQVKLVLTE